MQSTFWMIRLTEPIEHVFRICAEILEPFIENFGPCGEHLYIAGSSVRMLGQNFEAPLEARYLKLAASGS